MYNVHVYCICSKGNWKILELNHLMVIYVKIHTQVTQCHQLERKLHWLKTITITCTVAVVTERHCKRNTRSFKSEKS